MNVTMPIQNEDAVGGWHYPSNMAVNLRPYQWDGVSFLQDKKRAMIADPPGLGKTHQAMMAAADGERIGIICPPYLVTHWWDKIREQFPLDSIVMVSGNKADRTYALGHQAKWMIFNKEMMRFNKKLEERELPRRKDLKFTFPDFDTLILDESQHFRNRKSQQSRAAFVLAYDADRVFLLTGTPIMKDPDDLFMQLRLMDPVTFSSYWQFVNTYCTFEQNGYGYKITGQRGDALKRLMQRYALRRSYEEVGLWLPRAIENYVRVDFSPANKARYKTATDELRVGELWIDSFMQCLHILRALTGVTEKLAATVELCKDLDKFLIFTWYTGVAKKLAEALDATLIISEEVPPDQRRDLVAKSERVVCTLGSLSEGVDASHLRNVVFFEEYYVPGQLDQALKRVQRWNEAGEKEDVPVNVYYIMVKDTIDEGIHSIQKSRGATIKSIVRDEINGKRK